MKFGSILNDRKILILVCDLCDQIVEILAEINFASILYIFKPQKIKLCLFVIKFARNC